MPIKKRLWKRTMRKAMAGKHKSVKYSPIEDKFFKVTPKALNVWNAKGVRESRERLLLAEPVMEKGGVAEKGGLPHYHSKRGPTVAITTTKIEFDEKGRKKRPKR